MTLRLSFAVLLLHFLSSSGARAYGQSNEQIQEELARAKAERAVILEELDALKNQRQSSTDSKNPFTFGGYGEIHYNDVKGSGGDYLDIHRFVFYLGHPFNDWIQLHSELEIERSYVANASDSGGYLLFEQLYFDFLLSRPMNVRFGRVLAPLGIINQTHEPTTFNGVERPNYSRVILLNTWSLDGLGLFGSLGEQLKYEAYASSGLDGSRFNELDGLRNGRMRERPGTSSPAYSVRLEALPISAARIGMAYMRSGVNNGNLGQNPGLDSSLYVEIIAFDARYSIWLFDLRAEAAETTLTGAGSLNNFLARACDASSTCVKSDKVAKKMRGNLAEVAVHAWPNSFRQGKLANSDLVLFGRRDVYNTQAEMPDGVKPNKAADRTDLTFGLSFFPERDVVVKIDRQSTRSSADQAAIESFNAGLGWSF